VQDLQVKSNFFVIYNLVTHDTINLWHAHECIRSNGLGNKWATSDVKDWTCTWATLGLGRGWLPGPLLLHVFLQQLSMLTATNDNWWSFRFYVANKPTVAMF